jgi:DNA-binding NtrC family response regulator
MPARIVIVHDEPGFTERIAAALRGNGHDVASFVDPIEALDALQDAQRIEVLVTRLSFPDGRSNGVSLALMARARRSDIKVLFAGAEENRAHAEGLGEFLPLPVTAPSVVAAVKRLLTKT